MTSFVDYEIDYMFEFDPEELLNLLMEAVMDYEKCEFETQVNLLLTDSEGIREYNLEYRNIDKETDVLSFPAIDFETPGNFDHVLLNESAYFDPETGELMLGDIIINKDRVLSQAEEYGHSVKREFAFLLTHSLFHLCGYDHMTEADAADMERRQKEILNNLGITRDI